MLDYPLFSFSSRTFLNLINSPVYKPSLGQFLDFCGWKTKNWSVDTTRRTREKRSCQKVPGTDTEEGWGGSPTGVLSQDSVRGRETHRRKRFSRERTVVVRDTGGRTVKNNLSRRRDVVPRTLWPYFLSLPKPRVSLGTVRMGHYVFIIPLSRWIIKDLHLFLYTLTPFLSTQWNPIYTKYDVVILYPRRIY